MSTCLKRNVLQAPDRPGLAARDALAFAESVKNAQQRVLPHAGSTGRPMGNAGRPLNHGGNPLTGLTRALTSIAQATSPQRAGAGISPVNGGRGTSPNTPQAGTSGVPGSGFAEGRLLMFKLYGVYTEPMEIPRPANMVVEAVIAARIYAPSDPSRYFRNGVACDFQISNTPNNLTIRSIDGMTIGDPTVLLFTFFYFGS